MKKHFIRLLAVMLLSVMCLTLAACGGDDDTELTLIDGGKAKFTVVIASGAGTEARRSAEALILKLRELGIEVGDAVTDSDITAVSDCEIIIGTNVKNREDCVVTAEEIGQFGYVVKTVGKRVVIAGGVSSVTKKALEMFTETYLGITEDTTTLSGKVAVDSDLVDEFLSEYDIVSFTINGNPISDYVITTDYGLDDNIAAACPIAKPLANKIKSKTGVEIKVVDLMNVSSTQNKILIRYVEDAGDTGFRAKLSGDDFIIECSYWNVFDRGFTKFCNEEIGSKMGEFAIDDEYLYTWDANIIRYEDYGALGDGITNDFDAIRLAHEAANQCGQKVVADDNATYYIGKTTTPAGKFQYISVKTDVDFGKATIIIDDQVPGVDSGPGGGTDAGDFDIFYIESDYAPVILTKSQIQELNGGSLPKVNRFDNSNPTTSLPWLESVLEAKSLVEITWQDKKDYIRYGQNQNTGDDRCEVLIVEKDGTISDETPVIFDYTQVTKVKIFRADDTPITVKGGKFISNCFKTVEAADYKNRNSYIRRGICINRANTTLENINHKMQNEPPRPTSGDPKNQSNPYTGFIYFEYCYNSTIKNSDLTGHRTYYKASDSVAMGTYELNLQSTVGITCDGITQSAVSIYDGDYWGMMTSNYSRNITFKNCMISRFDAHKGFWNAEITDCQIGQYINVIGGGTLNITNVKVIVGDAFIQLRGDYGATFEGDVNLTNCELVGANTWNGSSGSNFNEKDKVSTGYIFKATVTNTQQYYDWNFGYVRYMPKNIVVDNFKSSVAVYVFNDIRDKDIKLNEADQVGKYRLTESITFKNMEKAISICETPGTNKELAQIHVN